MPQYPTEGKVPLSAIVRIRHRDTLTWLHAKEVDHRAPDDEIMADGYDDDAEPKALQLMASVVRHDEDVFGIHLVAQEEIDDLRYVRCRPDASPPRPRCLPAPLFCTSLKSHFLLPPQVTAAAPVFDDFFETICKPGYQKKGIGTDAATLRKALGELILFATVSSNADAFTREGLPHPARQLLLCEQGLLEQCLRCVVVPYVAGTPFSYDDLRAERRKAAGIEALHEVGVLSQLLARHILRASAPNKLAAMRLGMHIKLQEMLGYGLRCAPVLTEVFADSEHATKIDDTVVKRFLDLIRDSRQVVIRGPRLGVSRVPSSPRCGRGASWTFWLSFACATARRYGLTRTVSASCWYAARPSC